jgi:hypothetical protein
MRTRPQDSPYQNIVEHLDDIFCMISSGSSLRAACASDAKFPTFNQVSFQIRRDPGIRARYQAVKEQWKQNRSPSAKYFEQIIALIGSGMSVATACAQDPAFPHPDTFYNLCIRSPAKNERLRCALALRESLVRQRLGKFCESDFDAALQAIRTCTGASVAEVLKWPLPQQHTLLKRCARDPAFAERYRSAIAAREDPRLHRTEAYNRALDLIEANPLAAIKPLLKGSESRLPSLAALNWRIRRDPELSARAGVMRLQRRHSRQKLRAKPVFQTDLLASALATDRFYAAARFAAPKYLDPADRDDVISEMVLAMISGDLSIDEARRSGKEFARRFLRPQNRPKYSSLDEPVFADEGRSIAFVDTFTSDHWNFA